MPRLADRTCLITGAARGIGAAIARRFATEGAHVIVTDRDAGAAEALAREIGGTGRGLDVTDEAGWQALAGAHPMLDVLVNNAGITGFEAGAAPHDPEAVALPDWRRVMAVNLDGAMLGCRHALRLMRGRGGAIVNIASRSGQTGVAGAAAYAASKAGLLSLTKSVALHGAAMSPPVRCNAVVPGAVLTGIWEPMLGSGPDRAERMAALTADTPLARFGRPEEVAAACVTLASDESAFVTGAEFAVDGGLSAR
ncbi:SDR family NAD(P)-dependent oxidoreductase [Limimaricola pyoseonensis]|uniref:NAD(P)-dependent dehydrogenase, short-chain alcohol dehydrogenase family n=1 Tax=Limimaricola pyoseonensis TaxID=521013 RepID=A0A1G7AYE0_9RHOB|nr:SDR family oxidoreductase [Limimaricola pyoseonensis]SDE19898.1 NAD(P)-dependent dehydrogenase, short-chain alcohol dehydrogenase family [Limimaricola pyoseonensis]